MSAAIPLSAEENTVEALRLLDSAVETHEGRPADTNVARAQVHAILAVAERLADLVELVRVLPAAQGPKSGEARDV
ncbi:hypothetical protein [Planobispora rosea]|uniref:hypothetical protein n=1 Tax=Planobispora rosea TaxID=35762 RepID=UPI00083B9A4C|nr:hypothetical protein [Planobispora rosea]